MKITPQIRKFLKSVKNKRAQIVIEHILKNGFITTEELEKKYGYNHPPRAARDVREAGIPLDTYRVKASNGRWIAAYRFGDLTKIRKGRLHGRSAFPKALKQTLFDHQHGKCAICVGGFEERYLQIDHKIPYEVAGDPVQIDDENQYVLLCGSCNRAKSWSCEHCINWLNEKSMQVCLACYWANPDNHLHIGLREIRRLDILWSGDEIETYERIKKMAIDDHATVPDFVKQILSKSVK